MGYKALLHRVTTLAFLEALGGRGKVIAGLARRQRGEKRLTAALALSPHLRRSELLEYLYGDRIDGGPLTARHCLNAYLRRNHA